MKRIYFAILFLLLSWSASAQCIDALVMTTGDTITGIVTVTDTTYTIDSYNMVVSLRKDVIKEYIPCYRTATRIDLARMRQVDYLTEKDLLKYTPGYYLRKASRNFYMGISLSMTGTITTGIALAMYNTSTKETQKWILFSTGTVAIAGGIFFLLRSFYFIDKTGKMLDLERSTIYLEPAQNGGIELLWKF
jgi:hypothetical protein